MEELNLEASLVFTSLWRPTVNSDRSTNNSSEYAHSWLSKNMTTRQSLNETRSKEPGVSEWTSERIA
jgi:hypothetical protein